MSCYNDKLRLDQLRRCGCGKCYNEYNQLKYRLDREYYYKDISPIYMGEPSSNKNTNLATTRDYPMSIGVDLPSPLKIEEPKNIAVKLLVDKFKAEQSKLTSAEASIASYKIILDNHNKSKSEAQKNLKELGLALKKLGHKETK